MAKFAPHMGDPHGDPQTSPQHANPHGLLVWFSLKRQEIHVDRRVVGWSAGSPCGSPMWGGKFRHGLLEKSLKHLGAKKSTQTFFVQSFSSTLRVMDVRAENRGRPHQKVRFPAAPLVGRNFLTPGHPGVRVRNVRGTSGPKSLCLCCFLFPEHHGGSEVRMCKFFCCQRRRSLALPDLLVLRRRTLFSMSNGGGRGCREAFDVAIAAQNLGEAILRRVVQLLIYEHLAANVPLTPKFLQINSPPGFFCCNFFFFVIFYGNSLRHRFFL